MDCSTADVPGNVVHDSPASDDSSDYEPLIKKKTISTSARKTEIKGDTSLKPNGTNNKKADLNTDDSSDNEPLIKIAKISSRAAKKECVDSKKKDTDDSSDNEPLIKIAKMSTKAAKKKPADSKQKESLDESNSSDDEPLSELGKKLNPQRQRKSSGTPSRNAGPVMKSKRTAARKKVKYTESSSDNSDDEPLATMTRKLTKTSANSKKTKPKLKDESAEGDSSPCSDDDVPLSKFLTRPCSEEKQSHENTHSSNSVSKKDKSALDDSSDDEPLIKRKTVSASAKKPETKDDTSLKSNGANNKKADLNTDDSSDNEPLIKIAKMPSKAAKKKSADSKQKESLDDDNSSDDEPLSELRKKLNPQRQRKSPGTPSRKAAPVMKSKRNAARKKVKYTEFSSDSSDDEPLATMTRKLTKTSANSKKTKPKLKDESPEESQDDGDSSDDEPLSELRKKLNPQRQRKSPGTPSRKAAPVMKSKRKAARKRDSSSDDDVPLVNLIAKKKKSMKKNAETTTASKSRASRKRRVSSGNSSDDKPLIKAARHPQVTKLLRITLKRCDGEEGVKTGTGSLNKSSAATMIDEKTLRDESDGSEESPEEE